MKKILLNLIFFLFFSNYSYACSLLQVPIGTTVDVAKNTFDFLDLHNSQAYGKNASVLYRSYAIDYCDGSSLENADLEVIVYNSKIASINLFSDSEYKNEVYEFTKNYISNPGDEVQNDGWTGFKDLSVGGLIMFYSKTKIGKDIFEVLEISNQEMINFPADENIIEVTG